MTSETPEIRDIQIHQVELPPKDFSEVFYRNCKFCSKISKVIPSNSSSCVNLGGKYFYCSFCLRNNFHHKSSVNVLSMSFKAIIGYYYYRYYRSDHTLYCSEINRMIERHRVVGLTNPVFNYDSSTYLWFIDFNRIGNHRRKAPFAEVVETTKLIFEKFRVKEVMGDNIEDAFWQKIEKAITLFYEQRKRPKGKRTLVPTFSDLLPANVAPSGQTAVDFFEMTRSFTPSDLIVF